MKFNEEQLRAQVEHLMLDYRLNYLKIKIDNVRMQMGLASSDEERRTLGQQYVKLSAMRAEIADRVGKSIIV